MSEVFDVRKSDRPFDQTGTLVAVIELSQASWLVGAMVPGLKRSPLKKLKPDEQALFRLLERWRAEALKAGHGITRIAVACESGRDGFWLARWLRAQGIEAYVIHAASVAVSREHRRAKTDRLDTALLKRAFLGWLRGELGHCTMVTIEEPLHPFDVQAHAALARAIDVPILAGETIYDLRMFRDFMTAGALSIAQPDVLKLGGIAGWMEAAALARAFGLPVVPAGFNLMQLDAHLMAAIPHGLMMEYIPWLGPIFECPVRVEGGHALVPREPGAGTAISAEAIARYAMT